MFLLVLANICFVHALQPIRIAPEDVPSSSPFFRPPAILSTGGPAEPLDQFQVDGSFETDDNVDSSSVVQGFRVLGNAQNKIIFLNLATLRAQGINVDSSVITIGSGRQAMALRIIPGLTAPAPQTPQQSPPQNQNLHGLPAKSPPAHPHQFLPAQSSVHPRQFQAYLPQETSRGGHNQGPVDSSSFQFPTQRQHQSGIGEQNARSRAPTFFSKFGGILPTPEVLENSSGSSGYASFPVRENDENLAPVFPAFNTPVARNTPAEQINLDRLGLAKLVPFEQPSEIPHHDYTLGQAPANQLSPHFPLQTSPNVAPQRESFDDPIQPSATSHVAQSTGFDQSRFPSSRGRADESVEADPFSQLEALKAQKRF